VEAEESPLLEAITRERMVKIQQARRDLARTVGICEVWKISDSVIVISSYDP
jgi:hypothetical protein